MSVRLWQDVGEVDVNLNGGAEMTTETEQESQRKLEKVKNIAMAKGFAFGVFCSAVVMGCIAIWIFL